MGENGETHDRRLQGRFGIGRTPARALTSVLAIALVASALAVLPAAPAHAGQKVVITGGGWGHGLGLSQWGTYERARKGHKATRILRHYYSHTDVKKTDLPKKIRVGLLQAQTLMEFGSKAKGSGNGRVTFSLKGSKPFATGKSGTTWKVEPANAGAVKIYKNGNEVSFRGDSSLGGKKPVIIEYKPYGTLLRVIDKDNYYRHGHMEIGSYGCSGGSGRCMRLMSEVPLEEYVLGIAEVSASWPTEALRAQAIIARTYASHKTQTSGKHRDLCDCAVYDSTYDQVYVGDDRRADAGSYWKYWRRAVRATESHAVLYKGAPILALYMSSSGGHTENNEDVWGGTPLPYLRGVPDPADATDANVNHKWRVVMSRSTFSSKLNAYFGTGKLKKFVIKKPLGVSGRVTVVDGNGGGVRIVGSTRTVRASGSQVKTALGLMDTLFQVKGAG